MFRNAELLDSAFPRCYNFGASQYEKEIWGKMWNLIKWDVYHATNQNKKAYMPDEIFICQPTWCTILLVLSLGNSSHYKNYFPISTTRTVQSKIPLLFFLWAKFILHLHCATKLAQRFIGQSRSCSYLLPKKIFFHLSTTNLISRIAQDWSEKSSEKLLKQALDGMPPWKLKGI